MTLALRLLLAFGLLAITATATVGIGVREAWRTTEEQGFRERLASATRGIESDLAWEVRSIRDLLRPVCAQGSFVDQTLIDLERGSLEPGRRLAIAQLVPEEMRALSLDELALVTGGGEILGAGHAPAAAGSLDRALAGEIDRASGVTVRLASPNHPAALVTRCAKARGGHTIGLVGARHLEPILERLGRAYDMRLSIGIPGGKAPIDEERASTKPLEDLGGLRITAAVSRKPLEDKLAMLDERILMLSFGTLGAAIILAIVIARTLSRPIEALARQAREVVRTEPRAVEAKGGGRELQQLAEAFNQALEDLAAMRKRLAVTERIEARREVARQVAHEIKNPLAPIRAAVETLRRLRARNDIAFDDYFDEATRTVLDEVHRITKIVSEFTDFARLPDPSLGPVDITEMVRSIVALHSAGRGRVELKIEECPQVLADRDQLVQVLTNLLQNGLDAAEEHRGMDEARVIVRVAPEGEDRVRLTVADNGQGVPEELIPKLFEPYATMKSHGTGLGLAIVERIITEHEGEIGYTKGEDGGAVFWVDLPVEGAG